MEPNNLTIRAEHELKLILHYLNESIYQMNPPKKKKKNMKEREPLQLKEKAQTKATFQHKHVINTQQHGPLQKNLVY